MRQSSIGEGTKIAQAAKDLNVTSVTIRRYISEFNLETSTDENGVKVLPSTAMEELQEIRRLKEDGLTNPKVMELLEERRAKQPTAKAKGEKKGRESTKKVEVQPQEEEIASEEKYQQPAKRSTKAAVTAKAKVSKVVIEPGEVESADETEVESADETEVEAADETVPVRSKHSLTCQTCGKVFEHMNPRLRDCLDCYRTKRRERRRGSSDRHKNVIQHPLAQQATTKTAQQAQVPSIELPIEQPVRSSQPTITRQPTIRNYRKAIEDTRHITANLKRRLERPDLAEGERRWLEQIYAYQLILHQGWRHLAEYKQAGQQQGRPDRTE